MTYHKWGDAEKADARRYRAEGRAYGDVAKLLNAVYDNNRTADKVGDFFRKLDVADIPDMPEGTKGKRLADGALSVESLEPMSMDEVFKVFGLVRSDWRVVKFVPNIYGGKWQAKLFLEPDETQVVASKWDELLDEYRTRERTTIEEPERGTVDKLYEVAIYDNHVGLYSWGEETGQSQDLYIALDRHTQAFRELVEKAPAGCDLLYIVGQDLFHFDRMVDGKGGATAAGTQQDVDTRYQKLFRSTAEMIIDNIKWAHDQCHYVHVMVVPGNHDTQTTFYLGEVLQAVFGDVAVDNDPRGVKYFRHGTVLLGFAHGQKEKVKDLPRIMEVETRHCPKAAQCTVREWHLGHTHHEEVSEEYGVRTRVMPALASTDSWHKQNTYIGALRGARGFLWDSFSGLERIDCFNIPALTVDDVPATVRST